MRNLRRFAVAALALAALFLAAAPAWASRPLKEDTAVTVIVGPFIDDTDGKSAEIELTVANIDCNLYKNNGTKVDVVLAAKDSDNDCVHVADGFYSLELTATDTSTPGYLRITFEITGALIFFEDFEVLPANMYDSRFVATTKQQVVLHDGAHGGTAATLTLLSAVINNTGGVGLSVTGSTTAVAIHGATIGLDVDASNGPAIDVDSTGGNGAGLDITGHGTGSGILATGGLAGGAGGIFLGGAEAPGFYLEGGATGAGFQIVGGATSGVGIDVSATDGDAINLVGAGAGHVDLRGDITGNLTGTVSTVTTLTTWDKTGYSLSAAGVDALWDEVVTAHATESSFGLLIKTDLDAAVTSRAAAATALTNATWTDAKAGYLTGDAYVRLGAPTGASIAADLAALKAETVLIVADTGELQTDWHDGGRLDLILDAAGSAGDPWITTLPGAYTAGQAGNIIGTYLDIKVSAAGAGSGDILVNHNTGGANNLQAKVGGAGVAGVTVRAYLKSDYDAGTYTKRGTAVTGTGGTWLTPMYLNAATYTFTFSRFDLTTYVKEQAVE